MTGQREVSQLNTGRENGAREYAVPVFQCHATTEDMAEALSYTESSIRKWQRTPGFPAPVYKFGKSRIWNRSAVAAWVVENGKVKAWVASNFENGGRR